MKISKKRKAVMGKVDSDKLYTLAEATNLVKEISTEKFTIRNSNGEFTRQYIDLLKDFYLDLGE